MNYYELELEILSFYLCCIPIFTFKLQLYFSYSESLVLHNKF